MISEMERTGFSDALSGNHLPVGQPSLYAASRRIHLYGRFASTSMIAGHPPQKRHKQIVYRCRKRLPHLSLQQRRRIEGGSRSEQSKSETGDLGSHSPLEPCDHPSAITMHVGMIGPRISSDLLCLFSESLRSSRIHAELTTALCGDAFYQFSSKKIIWERMPETRVAR